MQLFRNFFIGHCCFPLRVYSALAGACEYSIEGKEGRNKYKHIAINFQGVMKMARKKKELTCTVTFTEGAEERITAAFVDLYYAIKDGLIEGPPLLDEIPKEDPA